MKLINKIKMSMKKLICKQVGGNHYQSDYQPLEFILKYDLNFIQGSIIKYVIRHKNKNKEVDLLKALSLCETGSEYDLKPSMSATEITEELIPTIGKFDVTILNFANGDMVGHTGNLPATIAAIECVDVQLKRIYEECQAKGVTMFILADHGNAEEMLTNDEKPVTKHTTNPV